MQSSEFDDDVQHPSSSHAAEQSETQTGHSFDRSSIKVSIIQNNNYMSRLLSCSKKQTFDASTSQQRRHDVTSGEHLPPVASHSSPSSSHHNSPSLEPKCCKLSVSIDQSGDRFDQLDRYPIDRSIRCIVSIFPFEC